MTVEQLQENYGHHHPGGSVPPLLLPMISYARANKGVLRRMNATAQVIAQLSARRLGCARLVCRGREHGLDLSRLLQEEFEDDACAWRQMPSRRIDQAQWTTRRRKFAQDTNQHATAQVIEHLEQREQGDAVSAARGHSHRADVIGQKSP